MKRKRIARLILTAGLAIAAGVVATRILGDFGGPARKWIAAAIALLLLSPVFLWQVFFPPPIDITVFAETVDYEFRDAAYAREFARINGLPSGQ